MFFKLPHSRSTPSSSQKPSTSANRNNHNNQINNNHGHRQKSQVVNEKPSKHSKIIHRGERQPQNQQINKAKSAGTKFNQQHEQTRRVRNSIISLFNRHPNKQPPVSQEDRSFHDNHVMRNLKSSNQVNKNHKSAPAIHHKAHSKEVLSRSRSHENHDIISSRHRTQLDPKHEKERIRSRPKSTSHSPGKHQLQPEIRKNRPQQSKDLKRSQKPSTESSSID